MLFRVFLFCIIPFVFSFFSSHAGDTLRLSVLQCEKIFLNKNLQLIAANLNIGQAEASLLQAKLWPNPVISLDQVNLWANPNNVSVFGDGLPAFGNGNFGRNQQIALSFEQLVETAGKRKKKIALEQIDFEKAKSNFQDILRGLKFELRILLNELIYLQKEEKMYLSQSQSISQLSQAYGRQVSMGNASRAEFMRLKALELETGKELVNIRSRKIEALRDIRFLLHLPSEIELEILDDSSFLQIPELPSVRALIDMAEENRPDYKITQLNQSYFNTLYSLEKAKRIPDLQLNASYDRGGNFMYNFVGFGVALNLPTTNRNQGNIEMARIGRELSQISMEQKENQVQHEIMAAYQKLITAIGFSREIEPTYEQSLDEIFDAYTKNFQARQISMIEFIDFLNAYRENKKIIYEAALQIVSCKEEINYSIGRDAIQ